MIKNDRGFIILVPNDTLASESAKLPHFLTLGSEVR
jgi:hypothetical protein